VQVQVQEQVQVQKQALELAAPICSPHSLER